MIFGADKKNYKWKCSQGHKWIAVSSSRKLGAGCPVCDNKQVLVGNNDMATTHPGSKAKVLNSLISFTLLKN